MRDSHRGCVARSAGGGIKLGLEPLQKSVLVKRVLFERVAKFAFSVVSDVPLLSEGRSGAVGLALNSLAMGEYEEDDVETQCEPAAFQERVARPRLWARLL